MSHFRSQRNVKVGAQAERRGHPTWATADYVTPLLYLRNRDGQNNRCRATPRPRTRILTLQYATGSRAAPRLAVRARGRPWGRV